MLAIRVTTDEGEGTLYVNALKVSGSWRVASKTLHLDQRAIELDSLIRRASGRDAAARS
jgi:hypothetical protein